MIYPEVDPLKWSYKHGVPLSKEKCRKCGIEVDVNIPIISKEFVGFESGLHECGEQYRIVVIKKRFELEEA